MSNTGQNSMTSEGDERQRLLSAHQPPASHNPHNLHPELAGVHLGLTFTDIERNEEIDSNREDHALQPYHEVKSLMWIKQNTVYSVALDEWDRKVKLLSERVDKKEKRSGDLKNEIYHVIGFFSVFQGVVLTAVTQLTQSNDHSHNCKRVWSPVILAALAWVCTIVGIWQKFSRLQLIDDERTEEDEARRGSSLVKVDTLSTSVKTRREGASEAEAVKRAQFLRNFGNRFKFTDIKEKTKDSPPALYCGFGLHFWIYRFGLVVFMLSVFTAVFIASHFLILCNRGLGPINSSATTPS